MRLYGRFRRGPRSKIFKNEDFGFTRVTVERPLRLRYQMTTEGMAAFLDEYPDLADDARAIQKALGRALSLNWNAVREQLGALLRERKSSWTQPTHKLFREVFTVSDPQADAVRTEGRDDDFEPDPKLRDFENIPLLDDINAYFEREVRPHVPDAWMDRSKDKVGYEINFNRHFYVYTPPRPLEEIDEDLRRAEDEIARLLREVVE